MKRVTRAAKVAKQKENGIHPIVKFLEANIPPGRISSVARKAGVVSNSIHNWFNGNAPTVYLLDYALHAVGYRLAVVPLNSSVPTAPPLPPLASESKDGKKEDKVT